MPNQFHPAIVHFPIVVATLLPFLVLIFAYMIKINKMTPRGWLMIIGLQLFVTITGYVSLESGEIEEDMVSKIVDKSFIHEHESAAEIFVGSSVILLVLTVAAFFLRAEFQFYLKLGIALLGLVSGYLAFRAGRLGGDLVYKHGAAAVYANMNQTEAAPQGLLPTPGMNTSESPFPVNDEENESLKVDENDYGNPESGSSDESEETKQED